MYKYVLTLNDSPQGSLLEAVVLPVKSLNPQAFLDTLDKVPYFWSWVERPTAQNWRTLEVADGVTLADLVSGRVKEVLIDSMFDFHSKREQYLLRVLTVQAYEEEYKADLNALKRKMYESLH